MPSNNPTNIPHTGAVREARCPFHDWSIEPSNQHSAEIAFRSWIEIMEKMWPRILSNIYDESKSAGKNQTYKISAYTEKCPGSFLSGMQFAMLTHKLPPSELRQFDKPYILGLRAKDKKIIDDCSRRSMGIYERRKEDALRQLIKPFGEPVDFDALNQNCKTVRGLLSQAILNRAVYEMAVARSNTKHEFHKPLKLLETELEKIAAENNQHYLNALPEIILMQGVSTGLQVILGPIEYRGKELQARLEREITMKDLFLLGDISFRRAWKVGSLPSKLFGTLGLQKVFGENAGSEFAPELIDATSKTEGQEFNLAQMSLPQDRVMNALGVSNIEDLIGYGQPFLFCPALSAVVTGREGKQMPMAEALKGIAFHMVEKFSVN